MKNDFIPVLIWILIAIIAIGSFIFSIAMKANLTSDPNMPDWLKWLIWTR